MLRALELSGFKSFADRTRFEFPRGISVVVGPNGSGKSNIVDAVKWVLGSQSAKSLRGKEMIDVIFNGCASRGPLGTGEVTLTLDNADARLAIDAKEVHVTRRVYRSGEGEYLLNRQPCRLRDIRELLVSTGITTEAYCIIEQGKVDALLQSSPKERRGIFEEAAGISQFKIKKATALRRLERAEQNLLRLSDIVDEVESRLRSVRSQAGKARRYRECAERLQQLRTEVGLFDWRTFTKQITARDAQLSESQRRVAERGASLEHAEKEAQELEQQYEAAVLRQRELEAAASATREEIAARQAAVENQQARRVDLQQVVERIREQLTAMRSRGADGDQFRDAAAQLAAAEAELAAADAERREHVARAEESRRELDAARETFERVRFQHAEAMREAESLREQLATIESQLIASRGSLVEHRKRVVELSRSREAQVAELVGHEQAEAECAAQAEAHQASLRGAEQRLTQVRRELARADKQHRQLEGALMRTRERIAVLSELEHRLEGLAGGVQEVLRMAHDEPQGPLGAARGVVADLFHVDVDSAPLVEMALGERAQYVVMTTVRQLLERLEAQALAVGGRVGFLSLDSRYPLTALDQVDLSDEAGVMGRADRFVECGPEIAPLSRRLLGRTWLVDRLSTALRLFQTTGRGLEFVTSDGELLTADGTLIVGPRQAAAGVLSRRSELRACHEQVAELEKQLAHQAAIHSRLDQDRNEQEANVASSVTAYTAIAGTLAECRQQTTLARAHLDRVVHELERIEEQSRQMDVRIAQLESEADEHRSQQTAVEMAVTRLAVDLQDREQNIPALQQCHAELQATATGRQIIAAKCEQRVEMLRHQADQAKRNDQERELALADTKQQLADRELQLNELEATILSDGQVLAELLVRKEQHAETLARQSAADEEVRQKRTGIAERIRSERQQLTGLQNQQHKLEVTVARLRHERQTLCERMQEDFGIDLEAASSDRRPACQDGGETGVGAGEPPATTDREAVEREIAELRTQINNIGAINMEALEELEQIEARFETLSTQYRDLVESKAALERIIQRINVDSRQLFLATLETVRGHFQELFRRLFGGGEADIVVDETDDVLECGIEIVARPPGKEACSISLLSGGEKTLTCVALLLAVFRSKPSPFCVLDEVDAALDEANIGRFIGVLREFLSFTQFAIVTHSKKTMAGADTIYGVTMEESGVSKRVSVRFEDVSEDGQISLSALRRAA
ncbi:MAG: chromosome segregation protein SMC [Planctomycetes bacterium]|nr:chromosome segregation protein SMC [Planctomycetota bacterium]